MIKNGDMSKINIEFNQKYRFEPKKENVERFNHKKTTVSLKLKELDFCGKLIFFKIFCFF